jgi:branched-chain amino acid transport system ATP-binding protein
MLKAKNLNKKFLENQVLKNCSFFLEEGEIVVLIGENGSGKSTLFNIILGIIKLDSGQVFLNGKDISKKPIYKITQKGIYGSFQASSLFKNLTVIDHLLMVQDDSGTKFIQNLFMPKNKNNQKRIIRAENILKKLEIEKIRNLPISEISYGQRKLVNIGMSLLTPQKILLLDEIFAGVNARLIEKIKNILIKITKTEKKSIVLITHDLKLAEEISDRIVYMKNGSVIN